MNSIDLSIIVPLYNEEECVKPLYESIIKEVERLQLNFEILFVDDGSTDRTFEISKEIAVRDRRLRVIKFKKNYGQTPAMVAGIDHARGKILVTMDGDLQNDPADIPKFLSTIEEGYDIVCGWRYRRKDKLITRRIPSVVANWIIGKITGVPIKDNGCSLKAYRAEIIKSTPLYSDMHRFIPAMASVAGTNIAEIKVNHHPRRFGVSKYGISRIYKVIVDLLVIKTLISFASRPLRLFAYSSLISILLGIFTLLFSFDGLFSGTWQVDFMGASGGLLFFILAFFLFFTGLLCELINKTSDVRSFAFIKRTVNGD